MTKTPTGNKNECYNITERAAGLANRLSKIYKLKVEQGYAPTSCHDDQLLEHFYEDVEYAVLKGTQKRFAKVTIKCIQVVEHITGDV